MLVRGVVDDEFGDDAEAAAVRFADEVAKIGARAVARVDVVIIGDVVPVVLQRRRIEGQKPERRHAEALQVIELLDQAREVADAVVIAVEEGLDVQLVDDRVLVPERVAGEDAGRGVAATGGWQLRCAQRRAGTVGRRGGVHQ